jgi:hypothetical protein
MARWPRHPDTARGSKWLIDLAGRYAAFCIVREAYGFYSNVNPDVSHPRYGQSSERRIGEFFRRKTLMFNGYGDQVASMYSGMDLRRFY